MKDELFEASELGLLRASDVAKILSISKSYVYLLMQRGMISTVNIGSARRVLGFPSRFSTGHQARPALRVDKVSWRQVEARIGNENSQNCHGDKAHTQESPAESSA